MSFFFFHGVIFSIFTDTVIACFSFTSFPEHERGIHPPARSIEFYEAAMMHEPVQTASRRDESLVDSAHLAALLVVGLLGQKPLPARTPGVVRLEPLEGLRHLSHAQQPLGKPVELSSSLQLGPGSGLCPHPVKGVEDAPLHAGGRPGPLERLLEAGSPAGDDDVGR